MNQSAVMKTLLLSLVFTALVASAFARPSAYYTGYPRSSQDGVQAKNRALLRSHLDGMITKLELKKKNLYLLAYFYNVHFLALSPG